MAVTKPTGSRTSTAKSNSSKPGTKGSSDAVSKAEAKLLAQAQLAKENQLKALQLSIEQIDKEIKAEQSHIIKITRDRIALDGQYTALREELLDIREKLSTEENNVRSLFYKKKENNLQRHNEVQQLRSSHVDQVIAKHTQFIHEASNAHKHIQSSIMSASSEIQAELSAQWNSELNHEIALRAVRLAHDQELSNLRERFADDARCTTALHYQAVKQMRILLDEARSKALEKREELTLEARKNLIKQQNIDIHNFHQSNLVTSRALLIAIHQAREKLDLIKEKESKSKHSLLLAETKNKALKPPYTKTLSEVNILKEKLKQSERATRDLMSVKKRVSLEEKNIKEKSLTLEVNTQLAEHIRASEVMSIMDSTSGVCSALLHCAAEREHNHRNILNTNSSNSFLTTTLEPVLSTIEEDTLKIDRATEQLRSTLNRSYREAYLNIETN